MIDSPRLQPTFESDTFPINAHVFQDARVLVWGALGLIGFHLTEALLAAGFRVSVLCRSRNAYTEPSWASRVQWHELNSDAPDKVLQEAVASASIIVDLAGSSGAVASNTNPVESLDSNCRAQLQFLQACQRARHRPHIVFASSRLVYGPTNQPLVSEEHPVSPYCVYGAHKLCIEQYLQIYARLDAITYTVCRISNAYGPDPGRAGQGYKILNSFIVKSLAGLPITLFGTGEQVRDFIYIHDLTALLIRCCVLPAAINQTFNIGSGEPCRLVDAASFVRESAGGPPLLFQAWPPEYFAVESGDYVSDIKKTCRLLELRPRYRIEDGIMHTIRAYQREQEMALADAVVPTEIAPLQSFRADTKDRWLSHIQSAV
jgi:UDP-glucose 4-epimerase